MAEMLIYDRIKFNKKGTQKKFILDTKEDLNITWVVFAKKFGVSTRTLTSWKNEKLRMSFFTAKKMSKLSGINIPNDFILIKWNDHLKNIGKKGGESNIIKHGRVCSDEKNRKEKWKNWWENEGKFKKTPKGFQKIININVPKKGLQLAEFIGIMLGDGGVAPYHIAITISKNEVEFKKYIIKLINKLFKTNPKVQILKNSEAINIIVQRKKIVDFCKSIGLVQGNKVKQQVDVPNWIKENKLYTCECIRGLMDTDGCFYTNSYLSNGKKYSYFKIAFKNESLPLIKFMANMLNKMEIKARINNKQNDVRIESEKYVLKYIEEIGSHNDKHLDKIKKWKNSKNMIE